MRLLKNALLAAALYAMMLQPAWAQGTSARITGIIKDATGAVLPGVTVTATSASTGRTWQTVSVGTGDYNFPSLPVGKYSLSAELSSFKKAVFNDIVLETNQVARRDIVLELGDLVEVVEINGSPVLQTDSSVVGTVISSTTTPALPLNGRNFVQLSLLTPGAVTANPAGFTTGERGDATSGRPNVNGNRQQGNNFQLDGVDNNQTNDNSVGYQPNVDAIQEFKLITSNPPAEFGNFQGGIFNITLKSGGNEFHGNLFEFHRRDELNARPWAHGWNRGADGQRLPKGDTQLNIFGGTLGGPIVKSRVFFFADYQGTRRRPSLADGNITVIPEAYRHGDFSAVGQQLFDPLTARPNPANPSQIIRDPFPNNQIPLSRFNPVARALFARQDIYPLPQSAALQRNFTRKSREVLTNDQGDLKFDIKASARDDISIRYSFADQEVFDENDFPLVSTNLEDLPYQAGMLNWAHTFGRTVMNEFRVGFNRLGDDAIAQELGLGNLGQDLGIADVNALFAGLPALDFGGAATSIGSVGAYNKTLSEVFQIGNNISITRGRHVFKIGGLYMRQGLTSEFATNSGRLGRFTFNGQYTRNLTNTGSTGSGIADFILGYPSAIARGVVNPYWKHESELYAAFVQDDWRIRPNLTLNIGVRYELLTPFREADDRQSNVDFDTKRQLFPPGAVPTSGIPANIPVGEGTSRGLYKTYKTNFQPRVGFAWSLADKMVMRAAYAITSFMEGTGKNLRLPLNPPFQMESSRSNLPTALPDTIDRGLVGLSTAADPYRNADLRAWSPDLQPARSEQWNLTFERQFRDMFTASAGYVGQRGSHIVIPINRNQRPAPGQPRPLDPAFSQITRVTMTDSIGKLSYHGLQVSLRQRFSAGFEMLGSYTWSKAMTDTGRGFFNEGGQTGGPAAFAPNPYDMKAEWGPAMYDTPHAANLAIVWDLPFGKGRKWMNGGNPVLQGLIGGWNLSTIAQVRTGMRVTPNAPDQSQVQARSGRPDRVGDGKGDKVVGPNGTWFDTTAFVLPRLGTFGSSGYGVITGPGLATLDATFARRFKFSDARYLELRGEVFNVTNTPIFNAPNPSINNPDFGKVLSAQGARQIQLGVKFHF